MRESSCWLAWSALAEKGQANSGNIHQATNQQQNNQTNNKTFTWNLAGWLV
jgi:hypothetical protein